MGKLIESLAYQYDMQVVATIDNKEEWISKKDIISKGDVIIDFSLPDTVVDNIKRAIEYKIPVVVGTTGWNSQLTEIKSFCEKHEGAVVIGSNFSIGVNIFFEINKQLAKLMSEFGGYKVLIEEIHHIHKLDSPSGTAITLADQIIEHFNEKTKWVNSTTSNNEELPIISYREDEVPGTHVISYFSPVDEITIKHKAYNRQGFAKGALFAANYIIGKKGFYDFSKFLFNKP